MSYWQYADTRHNFPIVAFVALFASASISKLTRNLVSKLCVASLIAAALIKVSGSIKFNSRWD